MINTEITDEQRLDWLTAQAVRVRTPDDKAAVLCAKPGEVKGWGPLPSDLRHTIDRHIEAERQA